MSTEESAEAGAPPEADTGDTGGAEPDDPRGHDVEAYLEDLTRRIVELGEAELVPVASALATTAFRRRSGMDLAGRDMAATARLVVAAGKFLDARRGGEIAVRVEPDEGDTVVDVNMEDGPFLVSTLEMELARTGHEVKDLFHPILGVERGEDGGVRSILPARRAAHRESWIHARLAEELDEEARVRLRRNVLRVLRDARRVMEDFGALTTRVEEMIADLDPVEDAEPIAFLSWLLDDHFVFLGAVDFHAADGDVRLDEGSGLGVLALERRRAGADAAPQAVATRGVSSGAADPDGWDPDGPVHGVEPSRRGWGETLIPGEPSDGPASGTATAVTTLTIGRTDALSTVHRRERMVRVVVARRRDGRLVGERHLLGLLSQKAFAQPASSIPVLRDKLRTVLEREDIVDHSHDERTVRTIFEAMPKYELFTMPTDDLRRTLVDLLESQKRQAVRIVVRVERHSATALVTLPRERFNADLRRDIQERLADRLGALRVEYHLSLTEGDQALMHFALTTRDAYAQVRPDELQRDVVALSRTWADRLRDALELAGFDDAVALAGRWSATLPGTYTAATDADEAVEDLRELEALVGGGPAGAGETSELRVRVVRAGHDRLLVKLFKRGEGIELSTVLPMLESLGLTAVEEVPHRIVLGDGGNGGDAGRVLHVHTVEVRGQELENFDVATDGDRLSYALLAIWHARAEADGLNRLVVLAGLTWREVAVLRAYRRYRRQVGTSFTEDYQDAALCAHPGVGRALVTWFAARFDPDLQGAEGADEEAARQRVLDGLDDVTRLDQDRILRGYVGLIDATLRTNAYQRPERTWLSLKFDSSAVPDMPRPVPHREIFVYSPAMEGVHLRGGVVARGGLRWSDRLEDVRTEVLGLMKAQITKNAMVVPTGAKGGFVLKRAPEGGDALKEEVRRRYEVFIRGLLDLTDNVVDGEVVPPDRVVRHDGDDTYLVVAADRGTATFSDLANSVSEEYGFWLADAFASGGSRGYDHKEMGITARGAWVAVTQHFAELDTDVQTESITVTGIGDMSGDVFGNGMLSSRCLKLVAAFDHRDVFIDPDPDPARSYAERERLFTTPGSTWQDYDRAAISPGGGVWSRTVKSIPLTDEMRQLLRVGDGELSPPELIRAALRAPVDLLFAGGVGTFVKASSESDDEVGDRANDAIRVDADEVGARVIGEGGNLSLTQRGRIAFARRGGRVNLDAIDNAGGVATSDAEVNLKILLQLARGAGEVDAGERDRVLAEVQEDVAAQVLHAVWRQAWAISREVAQSPGGMEAYTQLLAELVESGRADREIDVLPSDEELRRRRDAGAGFTRPELGVLLGASKGDLVARLLDSAVPDDPALRPLLEGAFPEPVTWRFDHLLEQHRLRRELVATRLGSEIVDRMGITWVSRTANERGCRAADVARSYWIARQVIGADADWSRVDALEGVIVPDLQLALANEIGTLVDACTRAYLRDTTSRSAGDLIDADQDAFADLEVYVGRLQGAHAALHRGRVSRWTDLGVDDELAERIACLGGLTLAPDVATVARQRKRSVDTVADAFIAVTDELPLDVLHDHLEQVTPVGQWERWQHRALIDELRELRRQTAASALARHDGGGEHAVETFLADRRGVTERVDTLVERLERDPDAGLAAVSVVMTALHGILD